jgi:hypothetical protein
VAGAALFRLSALWRGDGEFRKRIEDWLDSDNFDSALWALQAVPLAPEIRQRILLRACDVIGKEESYGVDFRRWWVLLHLIERADLARDALGLLKILSRPENPVAAVAVALRLPFCEADERARLSSRVAERAYLVDTLAPHLAERLVQAAPGAWRKALLAKLRASPIAGAHEWMTFIRALPIEDQRLVAQAWAGSAVELPWISDSVGGRCIRAADDARGFLFDLGLDEPPRREGEPTPAA